MCIRDSHRRNREPVHSRQFAVRAGGAGRQERSRASGRSGGAGIAPARRSRCCRADRQPAGAQIPSAALDPLGHSCAHRLGGRALAVEFLRKVAPRVEVRQHIKSVLYSCFIALGYRFGHQNLR